MAGISMIRTAAAPAATAKIQQSPWLCLAAFVPDFASGPSVKHQMLTPTLDDNDGKPMNEQENVDPVQPIIDGTWAHQHTMEMCVENKHSTDFG